MSKTTNKFSPEVRQRAIRMVLEHEAEQPSRWAAISSTAAKVGCSPATLHEWVKKTEVDSGKRVGLPSDVAEKMKALEGENRELRQANEIFRQPKLRRDTTPCWTNQPWPHNFNQTASGEPGAVHCRPHLKT